MFWLKDHLYAKTSDDQENIEVTFRELVDKGVPHKVSNPNCTQRSQETAHKFDQKMTTL